MNNFIKQLTNTSYWVINKDLCKSIGLENTLLLQHFIDLQYKIFGGNEFFQQQERIQEELNFTEYQVKKSTKFLLKNNLINVIKKGNPAKNFYSINELEIIKIIDSNSPNKSGENHLTSGTNITSHIKELNKKELKEKDLNKQAQQKKIDLLNNHNKEKAIKKDKSNTESKNRIGLLLAKAPKLNLNY